MQRFKNSHRHLRTIQHVALLLVIGPANKHRPRRVLLERQRAAFFRTSRGTFAHGQGNRNLLWIFGSDHRRRILCRAHDGLRQQARLLAGLWRRSVHDRFGQVSFGQSGNDRPKPVFQPQIIRAIRPSVPTTMRQMANSVKPRRDTKSSSERTTKRPAMKAAMKPTPMTTRSSDDSASRFL